MGLINIAEELKNNSYPGRGIILGKTADGRHGVIAYFIMGRSVNSRNRIFIEKDDGIETKAFDESKLTDPSLIIYAPVRVSGKYHVVTNGDQTDTIYKFIEEGNTFENALRSREFEPDSPNYTPRISGLIKVSSSFSYKLSILKSADGDPSSCRRFFYEYEHPVNGQGHFIHTYDKDGNPIPSFKGEPKTIEVGNDLGEFTETIWNSLNEDNKVSLFTRFIDLETRDTTTIITNKFNR